MVCIGMLGVAMRDRPIGGSLGGARIIAIVCSTYPLKVALPTLDCVDVWSS